MPADPTTQRRPIADMQAEQARILAELGDEPTDVDEMTIDEIERSTDRIEAGTHRVLLESRHARAAYSVTTVAADR